jgi:PII-like signaling protein
MNAMNDNTTASVLRIYLSERDRADGHPLFETVVLKAREQGMAGATVLRGPLGYGRSTHLHTAKILQLSDNLPLVVEIVDDDEKIRRFIGSLAGMLGDALATIHPVEILHPTNR